MGAWGKHGERGVILSDFARALAQIGDPRFRRVLILGALLALMLLAVITVLLLALIRWADLGALGPFRTGPASGIGALLSAGTLALMPVLAVYLMIPAAAAFSSLFVESVAEAVEDRHYPGLPPPLKRGLGTGLIEAVNFTGLFLAVNLLLLAALALGPLYIPLYWALNGLLLGRETFSLIAQRRLPAAQARALRKAHRGQIWLAGTAMAMALSLPLVALVIPVLGVASFTHLFHRLARA